MKQSTLDTTSQHWLALCALVLCTLSLPAHAARLAAVIGNDQYEHHSKLRKAGNDADAMAALLKRSGFTVVNESLRRDLSRAQMNQVFSQLVQKVRRDDEVVVFYSGHGLQYGDSSVITGKDFPKPFDRTLALSEGIQLKGWQEAIRRAGARFALFVVDACRQDLTEDGMVKSMTGEDALFRTMEPTNPPEGQMVIFSARSGQLSLDRLSNTDPNPNGVFTRVFLEEAQKPGVSILDVLGETEDRVAQLAATVKDRQTGQPHRQKPAVRNEAGQRIKFCFVTNNGQCGEPGPIPAPRATVDPEQEAWDLAKRSHSALAYQAYASAYPQGRYAQAAQVALAGFRPVQIASIKPEPGIPAARPASEPAATPAVAAPSVIVPQSLQAGELIDGRYQILAGGAEVKDTKTGLIWQRCSVGQSWNGKTCEGTAEEFAFYSAQDQSRNGWRVPTKDELATLLDKRQSKKPFINQKAFPGTGLWYWTSSLYQGDSFKSWSVYFSDGSVGNSVRSGSINVRLVR